MTTTVWTLLAIGFVLSIVGLWRSRQLWRDESPALRELPEDLGRSLPTMSVIALVTCVTTAILGASDRQHPSALVWITGAVLASVLIGGLPLLHQLGRHGRPRALVPPPLRPPGKRR